MSWSLDSNKMPLLSFQCVQEDLTWEWPWASDTEQSWSKTRAIWEDCKEKQAFVRCPAAFVANIMSLIETSKYTSQARQQISQKNLRFGLYSSQGIPGKSQLVYCEACFLTLLTDVREGVPWGPGGTGSGEVSESPPPPTEAITVTAASTPSSPRAGQNIMGCTGHSSNPQGPPFHSVDLVCSARQWGHRNEPDNRGLLETRGFRKSLCKSKWPGQCCKQQPYG